MQILYTVPCDCIK